MRFIDEVIENSKKLWDDVLSERFLKEMEDGSLTREKFFDYMVQDSIYLRDYLKTFAYAMIKSETLADMQFFYSLLSCVNDGENMTRLKYLSDAGITDSEVDKTQKRPQCRAYTEFLLNTARDGDVLDIIFSVLPCMLGYYYVFEKFKKRAPHLASGYYAMLMEDYANEGYRQSCEFWKDMTEKRCCGISEEKKKRLNDIFRCASEHELYFWQMAGEDR